MEVQYHCRPVIVMLQNRKVYMIDGESGGVPAFRTARLVRQKAIELHASASRATAGVKAGEESMRGRSVRLGKSAGTS